MNPYDQLPLEQGSIADIQLTETAQILYNAIMLVPAELRQYPELYANALEDKLLDCYYIIPGTEYA